MTSDTRRFYVEGVCGDGDTVPYSNACFLFCTQLDTINKLEVGQEARVTFRSGVGSSDSWVRRVA